MKNNSLKLTRCFKMGKWIYCWVGVQEKKILIKSTLCFHIPQEYGAKCGVTLHGAQARSDWTSAGLFCPGEGIPFTSLQDTW